MKLSNELVDKTFYLSLVVQIITSLVSLDGLQYKLHPKDMILHDILKLELFVQLVETIFYVWIISSRHNLNTIVSRRYIDWVITTPTMLISTIAYMDYQGNIEKNNGVIIDNIYTFINQNKENIEKIVLYNGLMLMFGYLGETNQMDKYTSVSIGFIFFYLSFNIIYQKYAIQSESGKEIFKVLLTLWSLYGVSAILNPLQKNICYNILDVFSKNFYGLFIYYKIRKLQN